MIERPEYVLVIREPVQSQYRIHLFRKLDIAYFTIRLPHGFVHVLCNHFCRLVASRLEASLEGIDKGVTEPIVMGGGSRTLLWGCA